MVNDLVTVWGGTLRAGRTPAVGEILLGNGSGMTIGGDGVNNTALTPPQASINMETTLSGGILNYGFAGYYGQFYDTTTQANTNAPTGANIMSFNSVTSQYGVTCESNGTANTRIKVARSGVYDLQFSTVFEGTNANAKNIYVWFKKNGTNVPNSNTRITIAGQIHAIAAWNVFFELAANDYVEMAWSCTDSGVQIAYEAASASPDKPAVPSIIATMNLVR